MSNVRKAKLTVEPDDAGGSRVVIEHYAGLDDGPTHSRMFYVAQGERMRISVRSGHIIFESLGADTESNFARGLLGGILGSMQE